MIYKKLALIFCFLVGFEFKSSAVFAEKAEFSNDFYEVQLSWQAVEGVKHYKIQISPDISFHQLLEEGESFKEEWTWHYKPQKHTGFKKIYYRIASIDEKGEVGEFSEPQELELPSIEIKELKKAHWQLGTFLGVGWGGFSQTGTAADLKSVSSAGLTFQQRAALDLNLLLSERFESASGKFLSENLPHQAWTLVFDFSYALYKSRANSSGIINQPNSSTYLFETKLLRWFNSDSQWLWGGGIVAIRSFYWAKSGVGSVSPQYSFSIGPSFALSWHPSRYFWLVPHKVSFAFNLPLSGAFTSGQAGGSVTIAADWDLLKQRLGSRVEGDLSFLQWPTQTRYLNSGIWGGLIYFIK